jgi:hypothetical protein
MGKVGGRNTDRSTGITRLINFSSRCHLVYADVTTAVRNTSAELRGSRLTGVQLQDGGVRLRMCVKCVTNQWICCPYTGRQRGR